MRGVEFAVGLVMLWENVEHGKKIWLDGNKIILHNFWFLQFLSLRSLNVLNTIIKSFPLKLCLSLTDAMIPNKGESYTRQLKSND